MATFTGTAGADDFVGVDRENDLFRFDIANFTTADRVDGGNWTDTLELLGSGTVGDALMGVRNVEIIAIPAGDMVLDDPILSSLQASSYRVGSGLLDATAIADRSLHVTAGAGGTVLSGGGDDHFSLAPEPDGTVLDGGAGYDTLTLGAGPVEIGDTGSFRGSIDGATIRRVEQFNLSWAPLVRLNDAIVDDLRGRTLKVVVENTQFAPFDMTIDASALTGRNRVDVHATASTVRSYTLLGGAGDDIFRITKYLPYAHTVAGGAGRDTLVLDMFALSAAQLASITGIEHIELKGTYRSQPVSLELTDAFMVANAADLTIRNVAFGARIDASGIADAGHTLDVRNAAARVDFIGGMGADTFRFETAFDRDSRVEGGGGSAQDVLQLSVAHAAGLDFARITGIEHILLGAPGTTVLADATVATAHAQRLVVVGTAGNDTIDARAVTGAGNHVEIVAGAGNDRLYGSAGDDVFHFFAANLDAADVADGGAGADRLLINGPGAVTLGGAIRGVEAVSLSGAGVALTIGAAFAANNAALTVRAGGGDDRVDAALVTDARFRLVASTGAGADRIAGGAGADLIDGGAGADVLTGGAGADAFRFVARGAGDTITDFAAGEDRLAFTHAFAVTGALDLLREDATGTDDIAGSDVIRYTGAPLDGDADVRAYLRANGTGTSEGAFVLTHGGDGATLVWHVIDATGLTGQAVLVANLGATAVESLTIADFVYL